MASRCGSATERWRRCRPASRLRKRGAICSSAATERWPGVLIEPKPHGCAIHYRLAPERHDDVWRVVRALVPDDHPWFRLIPARECVEIGPRSTSKGHAVERFMKDNAFKGRRPIFVGDDFTDEAGMSAARARRRGLARAGGLRRRSGAGARLAVAQRRALGRPAGRAAGRRPERRHEQPRPRGCRQLLHREPDRSQRPPCLARPGPARRRSGVQCPAGRQRPARRASWMSWSTA